MNTLALALFLTQAPVFNVATAGTVDSGYREDDNDRDGWGEDEDCNDGEALMNPGQTEDCSDGLDNDCDTYTDDLDADCLPDKDNGCSAAPPPATGGGMLLLLGFSIVSARRQARPARSSRRHMA
jgi:uncharacterized protein (TIGR03382 family)